VGYFAAGCPGRSCAALVNTISNLGRRPTNLIRLLFASAELGVWERWKKTCPR
jgi:hypothetical protein